MPGFLESDQQVISFLRGNLPSGEEPITSVQPPVEKLTPAHQAQLGRVGVSIISDLNQWGAPKELLSHAKTAKEWRDTQIAVGWDCFIRKNGFPPAVIVQALFVLLSAQAKTAGPDSKDPLRRWQDEATRTLNTT